jgi:hypothetical protein
VSEPSILVTSGGVTYSPGNLGEHRLQPRMPGDHVWISAAAFRLTDESAKAAMTGDGQVHLDMENLATLSVGCYVCEQPWSQRLAHRRCTGEPS